jgi:hypothetical protein
MRYGLNGPANFEGREYHLVVTTGITQIAEAHGTSAAEVNRRLQHAQDKLLRLRANRVRPQRDEKILTSWNALVIRGLATAARVLGRDDLTQAATAALSFLRAHHWHDGRLLVTSAGADARLNAYLDDYVFLADAILELATVRVDTAELDFAIALLEVVLKYFVDDQRGGFFFTSDDHEALFSRPKSFGDEALPAGNGIAAVVLQRFGYLLGESRYLMAAERTVRSAWASIQEYPSGHATLLQALEEMLEVPVFVILRGPKAVIETWRAQLAAVYAPARLVLAVPSESSAEGQLTDWPGFSAKPGLEGGAAYVCRGTQCSAPLTTLGDLIAELGA